MVSRRMRAHVITVASVLQDKPSELVEIWNNGNEEVRNSHGALALKDLAEALLAGLECKVADKDLQARHHEPMNLFIHFIEQVFLYLLALVLGSSLDSLGNLKCEMTQRAVSLALMVITRRQQRYSRQG